MINNIINSNPRLRIEYLLKNIQLPSGNVGTSLNNFALLIGLKRSEALYNIIRNGDPITEELADRIHNYLPACTKEWILNGKGEAPECPIKIISTTVNPWWPDKQSGEHTASIIGCWLLVKIRHCVMDAEPAQWIESPKEKNANSSAIFLEFKSDKLVDIFEDQFKMTSNIYAYDDRSGHLVYSDQYMLVSKLTSQYMECISWKHMTENRIVKCIFRRIPDNFDKSKGSILIGNGIQNQPR